MDERENEAVEQSPRDVEGLGPQNEAERRLYALIKESIASGPSLEIGLTELANALRACIHSQR